MRPTVPGAACLSVVVLVSAACASSSAGNARLTVLAASSMRTALAEIIAKYREQSDVEVRLSYGGSDTLVAQIRGGAPADVLITADARTMGVAHADGLLAGPARPIATNSLAIAVAPGNPRHIQGLADLSREGIALALCAPTVPCGWLARSVLHAARLVVHPVTLADNVTAALGLVRTGEVDAALVYRTDVQTASDVAAVDIPAYGVPPNVDEAAVIASTPHAAAAAALVDYLRSAAAQQVLARNGFGTP